MNRNHIYWLIGFFHLLVYLIFRCRKPEIDQDLRQFSQGKDGAKAFVQALQKREYRTAFYYRLSRPFWWPLSVLLPKMQNCDIHCKIGGG